MRVQRPVKCTFLADEPIQINYRSVSEGIDLWHYHEGVELHFCESGEGYYEVDGARYPVRAGTITIVDGASPHVVKMFGTRAVPYLRTVVQFLPKLVADRVQPDDPPLDMILPNRNVPIRQVRLADDDRVDCDYLIAKLNREMRMRGREAVMARSLIVLHLVLALFRHAHAGSGLRSVVNPNERRLVQQACAMVDAQVRSGEVQVRIEEIARALGISSGHLRRTFTRVANTSLGSYIDRQRILRGQALLAEGFSVSHAAIECGYASSSTFARAFHKSTGMTPSAFQRTLPTDAAGNARLGAFYARLG